MFSLKMKHSSTCLYCSSVVSKELFRATSFDSADETFAVTQCGKCGLAMTSPVPKDVDRYYDKKYYGSSEKKFSSFLELLVAVGNFLRAKAFIHFLDPRLRPDEMTVLDVGCGRGNFLKSMQYLGFNCIGSEVESFKFSESQKKSSIKYLHGTVEKLELTDKSLDGISIWHVLEHTYDPVKTIEKASKLLKKDGLLAIAVPNFGSLQASIFGKYWFHLDLPRHLFHFTPSTLYMILEKNGFIPIRLATCSWEQNLFGFCQSVANSVFKKYPPNLFYNSLKAGIGTKALISPAFLASLALFAFLVPVAILENLITPLIGRGGTLIVYAKKEG